MLILFFYSCGQDVPINRSLLSQMSKFIPPDVNCSVVRCIKQWFTIKAGVAFPKLAAVEKLFPVNINLDLVNNTRAMK
jgi:hypothetical protein